MLARAGSDGNREGFFRFGAHAKIGVGFGEKNPAIARDHIGRRQREPPVCIVVDERQIYKDREIVVAVVFGHCIRQAEFFGQGAAAVGKRREWQLMLADHEVALALGLRAYGNQQAAVLAQARIEIPPGFELRHAVRAPAAAKKLDDQRTKGQKIGAAHELIAGVLEREFGSLRAHGENAVFNAGSEKLFDGAFAYGQALRLDEGAGVGCDLIELVLKSGHIRALNPD